MDERKEKSGAKESMGIATKRSEDFSEWYLEVVRRGNFKDQRTPLKGCDVILPWGYAVWERIQSLLDAMFKERGVQNCYFPMLIPEGFIEKEKEHFAGFKAEAAVVTEAGGKPLEEKLVIRPTSETIMYSMFSLWIRSYKDLPLKINQWCNIIRWDTKITKPFVRDREFLWHELHTAHSTREDALNEINEMITICNRLHERLAMAALPMKRTESDKFPGAEFSVAFDTLAQDNKVFQGPGGHFLGQNFAKPFDIQFTNESGRKEYVWQTCLGTSTRQIGGIIMQHGDDKGAVLPPALAPVQAVIIPILFKGKESAVADAAKAAESELKALGVRTQLDTRDYSPGFKFNEWELKGVPLRIEIGPDESERKQFTVVKRNDGQKMTIYKLSEVQKILDTIQSEMHERSKQRLASNMNDAKSMEELADAVKKGIGRTNWCGSVECEGLIKDKTGASVRGTLYGKDEKPFAGCVNCGKPAQHVVYVARAY